MSFAADFSISPVAGNVQQIVLVDISTGSDAALTGRTISLFKIDGSLLTGSTINWPIAQSSITISVLDKDYSLNAYVAWASSAPIGGSTYTNSHVKTFTGYTNQFLYGLIQDISANPSILNDTNYFNNLGKAFTLLDSANLAQVYLNQFSSQSSLDRIFNMISNQSKYF